jgi:hypothetical protein
MNARIELPTDERRQQLEEFAQGGDRVGSNLAPTIAPMAGSPERVFGAQAVAVYRDEARILQKIAALGAAKGDDWFYRFPVKSNGATTYIEGASIKLANDVARIYGNCDVDVRVFEMGDSWVFYARFTDFETGYSLTRPFQQRKNQSSIRGDAGRALDIAFQIGTSKAIRNVVVNALQTFSDHAFDSARKSLVDRIGKSLPDWRTRTLEGLAKIPVELSRVERVIGKVAKDWLAPDVAMVIAMMKAIADGMATADETFPSGDGAASGEGEAPKNLDGFANKNTAETGNTDKAQTASPQDSASPATADPASASTASPGQEAGAGKAEMKQASAAKAAAPATDAVPTNEAEWGVYADNTISSATDADALTKWWKDGKNLRNKCNVTEEFREDRKTKLDAKAAELKAASK